MNKNSKNNSSLIQSVPRYVSFEIPKDWSHIKLGNIVKLERGVSYSSEEITNENKGNFLVNLNCFNEGGGFIDKGLLYFSGKTNKDPIHQNDILIAITEVTLQGKIIGYPLIVPKSNNKNPIFHSMDTAHLKFKGSDFDKKFLYYFLCSDLYHKSIMGFSAGSTVLHLHLKSVKSIIIPFPPLMEQKKISSIISKIEEIQLEIDKTITESEELKKGLMQRLFTKGINHSKFKNEKFLFQKSEKIPYEWSRKTIGDVCKLKTGKTPSRSIKKYFVGNIPWITSTDLNRGILTNTLESITQEAFEKTKLTIIPKGTFVMATYGLEAAGTRGKCSILGIDAAINQACMAIFPSKELLTEFLFNYYLQFGENIVFNFAQGTKQQNLYANTIKEIPLLLPPVEEQKNIISIFSKIDSQIKNNYELKLKLANLKKGLSEQLLTGKIRVNI